MRGQLANRTRTVWHLRQYLLTCHIHHKQSCWRKWPDCPSYLSWNVNFEEKSPAFAAHMFEQKPATRSKHKYQQLHRQVIAKEDLETPRKPEGIKCWKQRNSSCQLEPLYEIPSQSLIVDKHSAPVPYSLVSFPKPSWNIKEYIYNYYTCMRLGVCTHAFTCRLSSDCSSRCAWMMWWTSCVCVRWTAICMPLGKAALNPGPQSKRPKAA